MASGNLYVGTCGWSFPDWDGIAYPKGSPARERLRHYASTGLNAVEINAAFQTVPHLGDAPESISFTVRLPITVTHQPFEDPKGRVLLGRGLEAARKFAEGLAALREGGRLLAAVAPFPIYVKPSPAAHHYVESLADLFAGTPFSVEFRAAEWGAEETAKWLAGLNVTLVSADAPRHPSLLPLTRRDSPLAYFRFHGRNPHGFETGDEHCDYMYSAAELAELAAQVKQAAKKAKRTFVFFNNRRRAQAFKNALKMAELLGLPVGPGTTPLRQPELFS